MVKRTTRKKIDSVKYLNFKKVADDFKKGAETAYDFEYFNAAGVLVIHSAIALADAITIKLASEKCKGENHYEIISVLKDVTPPGKLKNNAINQFKSLIDYKNLVSYSGDVYYKKDIDRIFKHFYRFSNWANLVLE